MNAIKLAVLTDIAVAGKPINVAKAETMNTATTSIPSKDSGGTATSRASARRSKFVCRMHTTSKRGTIVRIMPK